MLKIPKSQQTNSKCSLALFVIPQATSAQLEYRALLNKQRATFRLYGSLEHYFSQTLRNTIFRKHYGTLFSANASAWCVWCNTYVHIQQNREKKSVLVLPQTNDELRSSFAGNSVEMCPSIWKAVTCASLCILRVHRTNTQKSYFGNGDLGTRRLWYYK